MVEYIGNQLELTLFIGCLRGISFEISFMVMNNYRLRLKIAAAGR